MKFKALLLSSLLVAGLSLSASAFAQDDQKKAQTPSSQTQQPAANQTQSQAQPSQTTAPASSDQTQAQPADQSQATAAQDQDQPVTDQKNQDKDKKDKDKKDKKKKHSGGKDDVDAIGNRKVAGWDWYSIESEIRMGKEYATQIESSLKMVTDPVVNEYVNRIGQNLVRNSDAKVPFTIK